MTKSKVGATYVEFNYIISPDGVRDTITGEVFSFLDWDASPFETIYSSEEEDGKDT